MNDLSLALGMQKRFSDAEPYARQALAGYQKLAGETHPDTMMLAAHLSRLLNSQGRLDEAETLSKKVLDTRQSVLGAGHPATIRQRLFLAILSTNQGKYSQVESDMRAILGKQNTSPPISPYFLNVARFNLANALQRQGQYSEAQALCRTIQATNQSKEIQDQILGFQTLSLYALMLPIQQAEAVQRQAYSGLQEVAGEGETITLIALDRLINVLRKLDKLEQANQLSITMMELVRRNYPAGHYFIANYLTTYGRVLGATGQFVEAEKRYTEAWQLLKPTRLSDKAHALDLVEAFIELYANWAKVDQDGGFSAKKRHWLEVMDQAKRSP